MPDRSDQWSSRVGFIYAAMGSAVGLGSIWKFPYEVGTNGGTSTVFECLDQVTSNLLLPLGGLGLAIFGGWVVQASVLAEELRLGGHGRRLLGAVLRYIAPLGIAAATVAPFVL